MKTKHIATGFAILAAATVLMVKDTISLQHTHTHVHDREEDVHTHRHGDLPGHDHIHQSA